MLALAKTCSLDQCDEERSTKRFSWLRNARLRSGSPSKLASLSILESAKAKKINSNKEEDSSGACGRRVEATAGKWLLSEKTH